MDINALQLIIYDFDGVLTDNRVLVMEDGREAVFCNRADGMAIGLIKKKGIRQLILSTEENSVVTARAKKLGVEVIQGSNDKAGALQELSQAQGIDLSQTVYIGNDINDLEAMKLCGYSFCPSDAAQHILRIVSEVIPRAGGNGVIRQFYDMFFYE